MPAPAKPVIVLFDLETLPNLQEALKVWPQLSQYPGKTLRATVSTIICAGWKIYGEKKVHCINAWDFKRWNKDVNDDYDVCKAIYDVLSKADAVVTHNGKRFDWKFLQTRLRKHKLPYLTKIPHIDTKELASRNMYAFNNRLGYLGEQFLKENKMEHEGWDLWVKTWHKDPKALKTMEKYCKQDVVTLEALFDELKPFTNQIPNHNLWLDKDREEHPEKVCHNCGSEELRSNGWRHTITMSYRRYVCKDCGSWGRFDLQGRKPRGI